MPAEKAPTPIIKGKDAEIILEEMRKPISDRAKKGAEILKKRYKEK